MNYFVRRKAVWIILCLMGVYFSGCGNQNEMFMESIAVEGTEENTLDSKEMESSEEVEDMTESIGHMDDMEKVYQVDQFTFRKADRTLLPKESAWLQGVYDVGNAGLVSDVTQGGYAAKHSLYIGQLLALFGNADYTTGNNEDLLSYAVEAKRNDGEVVYLEAYYGPSGPAIGGNVYDEISKQAAKELEQLIVGAEPADFEISSTYEDIGASLKMGVKNGVPYYDVGLPEDMSGR